MPVTVGTTSLTYNDSTVQNSAKGVAKAWLMYRSFSDTIESSFNISSFTSIASGDFDFNFTTAMSDSLYVIIPSFGWGGTIGAAQGIGVGTFSAPSTTQFNIVYTAGQMTAFDPNYLAVAVFGD